MKKKMIQIILIGIVLFWMGMIFYFSAQNGTKSSEMSGSLTNFLVKIFHPNYANLLPEEQTLLYQNTGFVIRKLGHYFEYAGLGFVLFFTLISFTKKEKVLYPIVFTIGSLYAISDEIHQAFVSDRSPMVRDVFIDIFGLCTMVFILGIFWNLKKMKKKR